MPVVVALVSQNGGVGKSTLAHALLVVATHGMKVRLAELDSNQGSVLAREATRRSNAPPMMLRAIGVSVKQLPFELMSLCRYLEGAHTTYAETYAEAQQQLASIENAPLGYAHGTPRYAIKAIPSRLTHSRIFMHG